MTRRWAAPIWNSQRRWCAAGKEAATLCVKGSSRMTVGLDPNGDGLGGSDHEVLLDGELVMDVTVADKLSVRIQI